MSKKLVIVESPAKAKTIGRYLGDDFIVESSVGHIRDIPARKKDLPESKQAQWAKTRFGIDLNNDFTPIYIVSDSSKKQVRLLKQLLKDADELYLATDEDREGEAIAWHLLEELKPKVPVQRMVFHEITEKAIQEAAANPRDLDVQLVQAQETRRILDRLFGFEVSPVLWRRVRRGLSAGRVQSPATRILVERERERMAFVRSSYSSLKATLAAEGTEFSATLRTIDSVRVADGADFDAAGNLKKGRRALSPQDAVGLAQGLSGADFSVASVESKPYTRKPYAPFRTSTLQQEAGHKLRFGARRTMSAAQALYEQGFITYMRTDSTNLSATALDAARSLVADRYGSQFLPEKPRLYGSQAKGAQEAHEAIRPAGDRFQDMDRVAAQFGPTSDAARVYELIWMRTVASQMKDAKGESLKVGITADTLKAETCGFRASGRTITFPGFLRAYVEGRDDPDAALDDQETHLPNMAEGDSLVAVALEPTDHETKPPARYTEASLVKRLEELGIGRPSTYASIISTILDREYAFKQGTALVPTWRAFGVVGLLEQYFAEYVDYDFTAKMEEDLDRIASGDQEMVPYLREFYDGVKDPENPRPGITDFVSEDALERIDPKAVNSFEIGIGDDGVPIVARSGQYGPYLQRGEDRASIPPDLPPDELTLERAVELLSAPKDERSLGNDPDTGLEIFLKTGRYGPYLQLGERDPDSTDKPKMASVFKSMDPATLTLDDAVRLLSIPRELGPHPEDGEPVFAKNGPHGPYVSWGKENRSIETEEQLLTITLDEALEALAKPRQRRGAKPPLKELGKDPATGNEIVIKDGRFGLYMTDGETNVSFRVAETLDNITLDHASERLAEKRAKGPAPKKKKR
ncbi:MAG: type I DNA topoisomerase [Acidimicrobiia bacterium]|nr:type I DNA topoisomerase [Acidimicrobiia bacterium]